MNRLAGQATTVMGGRLWLRVGSAKSLLPPWWYRNDISWTASVVSDNEKPIIITMFGFDHAKKYETQAV